MIDKQTKDALNDIGKKLSEILPDFYGKVTFNFYNGHCSNLNVEQSIKDETLKERNRNGKNL